MTSLEPTRSRHRAAPVPSSPFAAPGEDPGEHLHHGLGIRLRAGDREGAVDYARRLRAWLEQPGRPVSAANSANMFLSLASATLHFEGTWQALTELYNAAFRAAMANEQELELRARERIALIHAAQGRLREARLALRRVELLSDPDGPSSFTRGARALVAAESLKPEAKDLIEAIVHDEIPDPYWPLLLLGSARWRTAHGGAAAVLEEAALTQISRSVKPQTFARSTLLAIRANALIAMGRPSTATNELGAEETLETPELALARASAEVLCGSPLKGARAMRRLATNQDVGPSVRAEALLMGLWPNPQDSVEAGHTIQVARELIEREGVRRVLLAVPSELSRLVCPGELSAGEQRNPLSAPVVLRGSERRVLVALAEEGSLRDVAHRLGISMNTLKTHARAIYQKLDVSSRADAVRVADRHGLLEQGVDDR